MITTRLTDRLGIAHPIVSAPMALASGGALAAAVSRAGGLGLIGGGYGDSDWVRAQFAAAGSERVGVGFITWSAQRSPRVVAEALEFRPAAVMLSFGDPADFAEQVKSAGAVLICQCQNLSHVERAIEVGADVVVAQGAEAGGHGSLRGTLSLVPEVADFLTEFSPETLLLAAGGIADGRALAASLALGADGVLIGTRLWASEEALVQPRQRALDVAARHDVQRPLGRVGIGARRVVGWRQGLAATAAGEQGGSQGKESEAARDHDSSTLR